LRARVDPAVRLAQRWLAAEGPGQRALVLAAAHWVAVTRTLTPRVAGGAGVPLRRVAPVVVGSAAAWATTVVLLARTLGQRVADDAAWAPAVVLGLVVLALLVRHWRRSRATSAG
jgi:membrane-associated protein